MNADTQDSQAMPRVRMHMNGPEFSALAWGSMRCEDQFSSTDALADHLRWLLDVGITTIDTASVYGLPHPYST